MDRTDDKPRVLDARRTARPLKPSRLAAMLRLKTRAFRVATYCVLADSAELRLSLRRRVKLRYAAIADMNGRALGECAVQDVSTTGARLRIPPRLLLPARFRLVEDDGCTTRMAQLVWRRGGMCGIRLLGEP